MPQVDFNTVNIEIGKDHVNQAEYVKFPGLLLDENLSWKYHLSELSKELARASGIFFKIMHLPSTSVLVSLYYSLFASFLQYGIIFWVILMTSILSQYTICKRKWLDLLFSFKNYPSPCTPIFSELKILKLYDLFHLMLLIFVYESVPLNFPCILSQLLWDFDFCSSVWYRLARGIFLWDT